MTNLKIKAETVHLSERVKVDPVEPEQVVAGELAQGGHDPCLKPTMHSASEKSRQNSQRHHYLIPIHFSEVKPTNLRTSLIVSIAISLALSPPSRNTLSM